MCQMAASGLDVPQVDLAQLPAHATLSTVDGMHHHRRLAADALVMAVSTAVVVRCVEGLRAVGATPYVTQRDDPGRGSDSRIATFAAE